MRNEKQMKIFIIAISLLLTSCAKNYYNPIQVGDMATVSLSKLSPELPEISIIDSCKSSLIENKYYENKKPTDKSKYSINIPAKRKISFKYNHVWFGGEKTQLVSSGSNYTRNIETKRTKDMVSCSEVVTFTPEKGKHYEVYFGKNINQCMIKVSEAYYDSATGSKQLIKIETTAGKQC